MPRGSWWMKQNTHLLAQVAISPARGASSSTPRSAPGRRASPSARVAPARSPLSASRSSLPWNWKSIASRSVWPLMARMRSPARSPAAAAGVRGRTTATTTPSAQERGFIVGLPLRGVGRVQEAHALHDVLKPRDEREGRGQPHHRPQRATDIYEPARQPGEHGEHLKEGRDFPRPRRPRVDPPTGHMDDERADHQDQIATDDDGGDPERQRLEPRERDERRHEQQLVGHWIEERAEPARQSLAPRHVAIEQVGQRRRDEHDQRETGLAIDEQRDEYRNQQNAQHGQPVGEAHLTFQSSTRSTRYAATAASAGPGSSTSSVTCPAAS